jgi:hypothetical protein
LAKRVIHFRVQRTHEFCTICGTFYVDTQFCESQEQQRPKLPVSEIRQDISEFYNSSLAIDIQTFNFTSFLLVDVGTTTMMRLTFLWSLLAVSFYLPATSGKVLNFLNDFGGISDDESNEACQFNTDLLSDVLQNHTSNNTLVFPENSTFHFFHGIYAEHVNNSVIQIDGTLRFERFDYSYDKDHPPPCIYIYGSHNLTVTSSGRGLIDGRGPQYWGIPLIGYLELRENRPRLIVFNRTTDLLIEKIILQDSPYHTLYMDSVNRVEVRDISIVARRTKTNGHSWIDLTAFNTDGIDVSGHNVHIHDVDIWTQDDCIAVKDSTFDFQSSNMTFERINATGLGFVIGSIGGSTVRNITFRDSYLHKPVKGIYLKFHKLHHYWTDKNLTGLIEDIRFENITMEQPLQWPIWIGPAQQADHVNPCHPNPCSLCWPMTPGSRCHVVKTSKYRNIELVNVQINNPEMSPGVILGSDDAVIEHVLFDRVRVTKGKPVPYAEYDLMETFPGLLQPIHDPYVLGVREEDWTRDISMSSYMLSGESVEVQHESTDEEPTDEKTILQTILRLSRTGLLSVAIFVAVLWTFRNIYFWRTESLARRATGNDQIEEPLLPAKSRPSSSRELWRVVFGAVLCTVLSILLWTSFTSASLPKPKWDRTSRYYRCKGVVNGIARGNTWPIPYCFDDETPPFWQSSQITGLLFGAPFLLTCCVWCLALVLARRWGDSSSKTKESPPGAKPSTNSSAAISRS